MSHRPTSTTLPPLLGLFFRFLSPWLLLVSLLVAVGWRVYVGAWSWWDLAVVGAITGYWPLHEWLIHVFMLHARPKKIGSFTFDIHVAKVHRQHHEDPWDIDLVFVPLSTYLLLPLIWLGPLMLAPRPLALSGLVWYFALSLNYEWIHYLTHTRYAPRGKLYKRLWTNHRLHHFKNEHYWYGVTMLSADRPLRTAPEPSTTPLSPTCRSILESA
jgi:hypothetical protein